jgi:hypothetical protein
MTPCTSQDKIIASRRRLSNFPAACLSISGIGGQSGPLTEAQNVTGVIVTSLIIADRIPAGGVMAGMSDRKRPVQGVRGNRLPGHSIRWHLPSQPVTKHSQIGL